MKHILLITFIITTFSIAGKDMMIHYRDGGTIIKRLYDIDSITFVDAHESDMQIDSIKFVEAHSSLPPQHHYCKSYVMMRNNFYYYRSYKGSQEIEDSLVDEYESLYQDHPSLEEIISQFENRCGKHLNGDFAAKGFLGGPNYYIELYFRNGSISRYKYTKVNYTFIPEIVQNLHKKISDTLITEIEDNLYPTNQ